MTTLTLIIPVRGRIHLVLGTLHSIELQTRKPDRLIIVDNGNDRADRAILHAEAERLNQQFPTEIRFCDCPGATFARNTGLEGVTTEWTMFFDSDDMMLPDHIASACACADKHSDADIVGWDAVIVDNNNRYLRDKIFPTSDYLFHAIMHGSLATQCYMARTPFFLRAGGWNPKALIWNDVELSLRLLSLNPRIIKMTTPEPDVLILAHTDSITGKDFSSHALDRNHTIDLLLSFAEKHSFNGRLAPVLALKRAILAGCCKREGADAVADSLYESALALPINRFQRLAIRFAYRYTAFGLPGAARIVKPLF